MDFLKKYYKLILLVLVVGFLGFYLLQVDYKSVWAQLSQVGLDFLWIVMATCIAYLLATKAWQLCLSIQNGGRVEFFRLFIIRQIGEALTLIIPTNIVGGEISKVAMLNREGVDESASGVSIVASRGLIIISYFMLAVLVIGVSVFSNRVMLNAALSISVLVFLSAVMIFLSRIMISRQLILFQFLQFVIAHLPSNIKRLRFLTRVKQFNLMLVDFFKNNKKAALSALGLSFMHWVFGTFEFYFILNAFDLKVSFLDAVLMETGVMIFKSIGGFIPGQIGIEEYGNKVMLGMLDIHGLEIWTSVSILRRTRQLFWIGISVLFLFFFYKHKKWKFSL